MQQTFKGAKEEEEEEEAELTEKHQDVPKTRMDMDDLIRNEERVGHRTSGGIAGLSEDAHTCGDVSIHPLERSRKARRTHEGVDGNGECRFVLAQLGDHSCATGEKASDL
jgi:hypothetical protein